MSIEVTLMLLSVVFSMLVVLAGLTDAQALTTAKQIWGPDAWIKHAGVNYQVGCMTNGTKLTVYSSKKSWEDAFSHITLSNNGTHTLSAEARDAAGNVTTSSISIVLCNKTP